jgi:tRNA(Ile)-lysidine synthase
MKNLWPWVLVLKPVVTKDWLEPYQNCEQLFLGFSGGLDSTVLLHLLAAEPSIKGRIIAVHINHGLSPNAHNWQNHCQKHCDDLHIPLIIKQVHLTGRANLEERARRARYTVFQSLVLDNMVLLTAHHRDDQAETLLLQLFRGAGVDGLSAMAEVKKIGRGELFRPLLHCPRERLEQYATTQQLSWITDESNFNNDFSRNFLRNEIIPLLQTRWPVITGNLARTARHCQEARNLLQELAVSDSPLINHSITTLCVSPLQSLSTARIRNVLRTWLHANSVVMPNTEIINRLISEVILAREDATPKLLWGNYSVSRYQHTLYLHDVPEYTKPSSLDWKTFPQSLILPSALGELNAVASTTGLVLPMSSTVQVRFRGGGEVFVWHGQTKTLKKLFQQWKIPVWQRDKTPLVYVNGELACVVGYAISDFFYADGDSYQITLS